MKYFNQFSLLFIAIVVLVMLQYHFWFGESGHSDLVKLQAEMHNQQRLIDEQLEINRILQADVKDLKTGLEAVEEHARLDLGLIKPGETFVQISTTPTKDDSEISIGSVSTAPAVEKIPDPLLPLVSDD